MSNLTRFDESLDLDGDIAALAFEPIEAATLEHVADVDAKIAECKAELEAAPLGERQEIATRSHLLHADRPSAQLRNAAVHLAAMRDALDEETVNLAMASETWPTCKTCGLRIPPGKVDNAFVQQLADLFGECRSCVADRFRSDAARALTPVAKDPAAVSSAFGLAPGGHRINCALEADRAAQNAGQRKALVPTVSLGADLRARQAAPEAFGAESCRTKQIQVREARYRVHLFAQKAKEFALKLAAESDRVAKTVEATAQARKQAEQIHARHVERAQKARELADRVINAGGAK